jgi:hypothetical protein
MVLLLRPLSLELSRKVWQGMIEDRGLERTKKSDAMMNDDECEFECV